MRSNLAIAVLAGIVALGGVGYVGFAQTGAPGPGWVATPGGGWVPPDHPLAQVVPPPPPPAHHTCSAETLRGTYGGQMQGTQPLQGGGTQQVIGVVIRTFDGVGGFTQIDNIKGSETGIVPDRSGAGTYQVNADCSGATMFDPGANVLIEERMVIVDGGREIRSMTVSPAQVMVTAVAQRIERR